jgi:hypothetical protein
MTQVIEQCTIKVTISHDDVDTSTLYGGPVDLWERAARMIANLHGMPPKGRMRMSGVELTWDKTGVFEVPELGGGDN